MDWRVYASLGLVFLILYMLVVPPKAAREKLVVQAKRKKRNAENGIVEPKTYTSIKITGITARRGDSTVYLTALGGNDTITFEGIAKGNYSETAYVLIDGQGQMKQHPTEVLVQNEYRKGDWGILAVTMSPGNVTQRSIVPGVIHESNAFKIELSMHVNPK
ncbi:hypothetical protein ST201phi2-1p381 [Pseudomonas phage 201phi2-1]|uniref:Uncharacterized protein n=1 Tax=Pseudomonas phage 201phi2-1 TaxID=198110 RepID=B3FJP1_BP201|nr:hypothetical protein ST201phi2-1p381 [Pseudomonas phage 201phi2-1]ABY63206.1 hypothetical protein 201phi2-1p381 [Pseudomonas phage 201phi2-1]